MVYCPYNMLNMFRAILCPSSGARDCMCVITAYGVQCLGYWLSEVRYRASGYASGMRDIARATSLIPDAVAQWLSCCTTNLKVSGSIPGGVTGISFLLT